MNSLEHIKLAVAKGTGKDGPSPIHIDKGADGSYITLTQGDIDGTDCVLVSRSQAKEIVEAINLWSFDLN